MGRSWVIGSGSNLLVAFSGAGHLSLVNITDSEACRVQVYGLEFLDMLGELLEHDPSLLLTVRSDCHIDKCSSVYVPHTSIIAKLLHALRGALAKAPVKPVKTSSGKELWSREEAEATAKAAILLDIAAMILRNPEAAKTLPEGIELLTWMKKHR